ATLYHCLTPGLSKSSLSRATGPVMQPTSPRTLGNLGGLIRRMPWVAAAALIGALAIAGLPPLNGFASEWMLFQAFLFSPSLPSGYLSMLVPVATAALALAVAMAGYVMVKFYGVVFLGLPREDLAQAHDADHWERAGLVWLAGWCVALGLLPALVLAAVDPIARALVGATVHDATQESNWLFLTALQPERASYSAPLF